MAPWRVRKELDDLASLGATQIVVACVLFVTGVWYALDARWTHVGLSAAYMCATLLGFGYTTWLGTGLMKKHGIKEPLR